MEEITWKSPRATDNLYRDSNLWLTVEEWKQFTLWYPYVLRSLITIDGTWIEKARCTSRDCAYHLGKAMSAANRDHYYIVVKCERRRKEGREKPVVFFPNQRLVEEAMNAGLKARR